MPSQELKRKLTAILSADVKGYSRLMGEDEEWTVRTLDTFKGVMKTIIPQHRGRVVDSTGDNLLAEFASVVDAVQASVEIQQVLRAKNSLLPENRRMEFRIGINLGDVIEEGERIFGDGVNIAARLEGMAEAGGICISGSAFEQIENKLPLHYDYLGEHEVKNINRPVRVYRALMDNGVAETKGARPTSSGSRRRLWAVGITAVLVVLAGAAAWQFFLRPAPPPQSAASKPVEKADPGKMTYALPDKPSIAVLPFTNMSDDPKQEFFSDGITEEIITALSKIPQFFVIARNSTFTYKGKPVKIKQVSEELGVQYVLEGSVRRDGERVRITAQLIDGLSGKHLWADRYDGGLKDIFALQDEITMKIITELRGKMVLGGETRTAAKGTKNMEAYLKYLQATEYVTRLTKDDAIQARKLCDEVIALDPEYPKGYSRLALLLALDASMGRTDSPQQANAQAMEMITKAISLDPEEGPFYALRGVIHAQMRQYDEALADAAKALSLEPNHPGVLNESASVFWRSGKPEQALPLFDRLFRLSPIPVIGNYTGAGMAYNLAGQYEKAAEMYRKAIQKNPQVYLGHLGYAISAGLLGRTEEASGAVKELLRVNPRYSIEQFREFSSRVGIRDQAAVEKYSGALRKAGLPETSPKG
jgi:TolB-like protein/class 3 adenylate cyclase/tetratricopeptide (TPR) repeat protein